MERPSENHKRGILESFILRITSVRVLERTQGYAVTKCVKKGNRQPLPSRTEQGTSSCLLLDFHSFPSTTCREENDMMHNLCTSQWLPEIYQWWIDVQFLPTKVLNSTKFTLDNINPLLSLVLSVLNWLWRYSFSGNRSFRLKSFRPGYLASYFRVT